MYFDGTNSPPTLYPLPSTIQPTASRVTRKKLTLMALCHIIIIIIDALMGAFIFSWGPDEFEQKQAWVIGLRILILPAVVVEYGTERTRAIHFHSLLIFSFSTIALKSDIHARPNTIARETLMCSKILCVVRKADAVRKFRLGLVGSLARNQSIKRTP